MINCLNKFNKQIHIIVHFQRENFSFSTESVLNYLLKSSVYDTLSTNNNSLFYKQLQPLTNCQQMEGTFSHESSVRDSEGSLFIRRLCEAKIFVIYLNSICKQMKNFVNFLPADLVFAKELTLHNLEKSFPHDNLKKKVFI